MSPGLRLLTYFVASYLSPCLSRICRPLSGRTNDNRVLSSRFISSSDGVFPVVVFGVVRYFNKSNEI